MSGNWRVEVENLLLRMAQENPDSVLTQRRLSTDSLFTNRNGSTISIGQTVSNPIAINNERVERERQELSSTFRPGSSSARQGFSSLSMPHRESAYQRIRNATSRRATAMRHGRFTTKDVVLLSGPNVNEVPRGRVKRFLQENNHYISSARIGNEWGRQELEDFMIALFEGKLKKGDKFTYCNATQHCLGVITFPKETIQALTGEMVCKATKQTPIYIKPDKALLQLPDDMTHSSDEECGLTSKFVHPTFQLGGMHSELSTDLMDHPTQSILQHFNPDSDHGRQFDQAGPSTATASEQTGQDIILITVKELLVGLSQQIKQRPCTRLNVCRDRLWENVKAGLDRKSFNAAHQLIVNYVDTENASSGAIDVGGVKRQFFTDILAYLQNSPMFIGGKHGKYLTHFSHIAEDDYCKAGIIIAMSLVHGGPSPRFLATPAYKAIVQGVDKVTVCLEESEGVLNPSTYETLKQISDAKNLEDVENLMKDIETEDVEEMDSLGFLVEVCGVDKNLTNVVQRDKFISGICTYAVILQNRAAIDSFQRGLRTLGVLDTIKNFPDLFQEEMCHEFKAEISTDDIRTMFQLKRSQEGSNNFNLEGAVLADWFNFLEDINDGTVLCKCSDILCFATGCSYSPSSGMEPQPKLEFLLDMEDRSCKFPKANTCLNTLKLPVANKTYEEFAKNMEHGILNCYQFGLP